MTWDDLERECVMVEKPDGTHSIYLPRYYAVGPREFEYTGRELDATALIMFPHKMYRADMLAVWLHSKLFWAHRLDKAEFETHLAFETLPLRRWREFVNESAFFHEAIRRERDTWALESREKKTYDYSFLDLASPKGVDIFDVRE